MGLVVFDLCVAPTSGNKIWRRDERNSVLTEQTRNMFCQSNFASQRVPYSERSYSQGLGSKPKSSSYGSSLNIPTFVNQAIIAAFHQGIGSSPKKVSNFSKHRATRFLRCCTKGVLPSDIWWFFGVHDQHLINKLPANIQNYNKSLAQCSSDPVPRIWRQPQTPLDVMCYIYTSGTTGQSKVQCAHSACELT